MNVYYVIIDFPRMIGSSLFSIVSLKWRAFCLASLSIIWCQLTSFLCVSQKLSVGFEMMHIYIHRERNGSVGGINCYDVGFDQWRRRRWNSHRPIVWVIGGQTCWYNISLDLPARTLSVCLLLVCIGSTFQQCNNNDNKKPLGLEQLGLHGTRLAPHTDQHSVFFFFIIWTKQNKHLCLPFYTHTHTHTMY